MSSYLVDGYHRESAAFAPESARVAFIKRTYGLLFVAVLALIGLEAFFLKTDLGQKIGLDIVTSPIWLIGSILLCIGCGYLAQALARSESSPVVQLMGLGIYVVLWALMLLSPLYYCMMVPRFHDVPLQAGILTLVVFGGLTAVVFVSKKDFSFLGKMLFVAGLVAIGLIIVSRFTPMGLGVWFSAAMIALACAYILYDTSNVLHHYPVNAHVAAALELFGSVAMLFGYIVRLMMQLSSND
jgi:uncharacterized protein